MFYFCFKFDIGNFEFTEIRFYLGAGLGWETYFELSVQGSANLDFQMIEIEKTFIMWIFVVPVVITVGGRVNLALDIATDTLIMHLQIYKLFKKYLQC